MSFVKNIIFLWVRLLSSKLIQESEAGSRYAKAAFELATDKGALEAVHQDLGVLAALISESDDLKALLNSLIIPSADKLKGLKALIAKAKFSPLTSNLLGVLAQNNRLPDLLATINAFNRLYDAKMGVVAAEVVSAVALSAAQEKNLTKALNDALGQKANITTRVDASLLGGLKVRVGSRLFDASLKTKLDSLKFALKRA